MGLVSLVKTVNWAKLVNLETREVSLGSRDTAMWRFLWRAQTDGEEELGILVVGWHNILYSRRRKTMRVENIFIFILHRIYHKQPENAIFYTYLQELKWQASDWKCAENQKYFPYFGFELTLESGKGRSSNYERTTKKCHILYIFARTKITSIRLEL